MPIRVNHREKSDLAVHSRGRITSPAYPGVIKKLDANSAVSGSGEKMQRIQLAMRAGLERNERTGPF